MSKFNQRPSQIPATGPVSTVAPMLTAEGGAGYQRDAKSELFLLAVANMVGEDTYYESGSERDQRFRSLIHEVTLTDPSWVARFVPFLRNEMNLRTASVVMAAEYAIALRTLSANQPIREVAPSVRSVVNSALVRADEPAEFISYWRMRSQQLRHNLNSLPGGVQRGVADSVTRLYTERNVLKYDGNSKAMRFADVIELTHPTASAPWQDDLFRLLLDERHHRDAILTNGDRLETLMFRRWLDTTKKEVRREILCNNSSGAAEVLKNAGATWEWLSGWLPGGMDAEAWEWIIPSMGYMALLRNLRNFDQAGVSDAVAQTIAAKLSDPEEVARSRQFPFRFLAAYQAASGSLRWSYALEKALQASLSNVPALPGRTLILVDRSGSMFWDKMSKRSDLTRADGAAVFGCALALRAEDAELVQFGTASYPVQYRKGDAILPLIRKFRDLGETNTAHAVREHYAGHDRVIIVTDEQAHDGNVSTYVPVDVPLYTWNLAGYQAAHGESGMTNRHTFGGLSDVAFRMIPLLESHKRQGWPF